MHLVEDRLMPLLMRDGIYARLGSLTTGSGFAYGAGLRNRALVDGRGTLDVWAAGSREKFWTVEGRVGYPVTAGGEVTVEGYGRRYSYPSVDFSGLGPDSAGGDLSEFKSHGSLAGGAVRVAPGRVVRAGGGINVGTPVAVIEHGTRPNEVRAYGTLGDVANLIQVRGISGPALLIIGEVAALALREETAGTATSKSSPTLTSLWEMLT
jgi:hypothetical protein